MGWRFRQPARLGPFRVNVGKSGVGYSGRARVSSRYECPRAAVFDVLDSVILLKSAGWAEEEIFHVRPKFVEISPADSGHDFGQLGAQFGDA